MSENGKGSKPRPISVDRETFESNWAKIFGRKITKKKEKKDTDENPPSDS